MVILLQKFEKVSFLLPSGVFLVWFTARVTQWAGIVPNNLQSLSQAEL